MKLLDPMLNIKGEVQLIDFQKGCVEDSAPEPC